MTERKLPKIGVAVVVVKDGKVLIGKRLGAHGGETWQLPGGHLEMFESWDECAQRETMEEAGVKITNLQFVGATNDIMTDSGKHYITLFMRAQHESGEAMICEPDSCGGWEWFDWDDIPTPRFSPLQRFIDQGYHPHSTKHDKLVRDLIPKLIQNNNEEAVYRIASEREYPDELRLKLIEEVLEYLESHEVEKLADMLEVIYSLSSNHGIPREKLDTLRANKSKARGGFEKRIILEETRRKFL